MHISWSTSSARSKGGRSKRELFLSFRSLPSPFNFSLFLSPEKLDTQARASVTKTIRRGEGENICYYPPPPPTKEAKNRWANTAYVLYPKFAWDVMVREKTYFGPNPPL